MVILNCLKIFFVGANYLTFVFLLLFVFSLLFKFFPKRY